MEEAEIIARWNLGFAQDALPKAEQIGEEEARRLAEQSIRTQRVIVWAVDDRPVSQAGLSGTDEVARINAVYTPPGERGKGYAAATVAHLSRMQIDAGKSMCCLYADARNPVSNSIYRKIGYEFVGRSSLYVFGKSHGR
jgi:predicted GNAT family acetyltransferase